MSQISRQIARSFSAGLGAVCATAALVMLVNAGATPDQPLMVLERVVITGKSALPSVQVAQLPRVVIEGRRSGSNAEAPAELRLAALSCAQPAQC